MTLAAPPPTDTEAFAYTVGGHRVADPYHWLEGTAAPEVDKADPALDARVGRWTDAQNAYTRTLLDALPGRAEIGPELFRLLSLDDWGVPRMAGDALFYTLRKGREAQPVLYLREGADAAPRTLLDVNALDPEGLLALAWYRPSPNGRYVAFGTHDAGDENTTCHVLETATGRRQGEPIAGRVDPVDWLADNRHFVVRRLSDANNPYSGQILLHALGRDVGDDPVLLTQYTQGPLATTWGPYPVVSEDGRWLAIVYFTGTDSSDVWFYDLAAWRRHGKLERRDLVVGEDALTEGFIAGDTFYALTTLGAPNKRIVAFDLAGEEPDVPRELVAGRKDAVIVGAQPAGPGIVATYLQDARHRVALFDFGGRHLRDLELPGLGSVSVVAHRHRDTAWLRFDTFTEPPGIYRADLKTGRAALWQRPSAGTDAVPLTVEQVHCRSADGTDVPMFVVHRQGLALRGDNPTILYGYGGFGIALTPSFLAAWQPWLARGGVFAIANLRGGGERGEAWHRAGMRANKQKVFDDFYAAAEWLIARRYTRRERLGIVGRSNGGLLTGVAITQRPDLFAAAIVGVPLLDMLRYQSFSMARYWVPEYGSAENPDQYAYLRAYSPYHNVKAGVAYPAVLLTAGENDSRVAPLHARKMAAALQRATSADPAARPILLWIDRETGHGQGKPLKRRLQEAADALLFMARQLGLKQP